jgi:hypothetical protein
MEFMLLISLFCLAVPICIIIEIHNYEMTEDVNKSLLRLLYIFLSLILIFAIVIIIPDFITERLIDDRQLTLLGFGLLSLTYVNRIDSISNRVVKIILSILLVVYTLPLIYLITVTTKDDPNSLIKILENIYIGLGLTQTLFIFFAYILKRIRV